MAYHKAAVEALKELGKAAVPAITKWIKASPSSGIADFKPALLKAALKKAVEKGTIVQISASYTLPVGAEAGLSASYPRLARCPYKIECAKSNRSFCRASRKTIDTGALRLAPPLCKTGNDGDERAMWYALPALFEMFRDHPNAFWISSVEQIAGFDKLKPADKEVVQEHITALVEERKAAGAEPVHTVYTKPCWERRALIALVANDKAALKAALTEDGADVTTKVGSPRLGSNADGKFKESDVQIKHCGESPWEDYGCFDGAAEAVGLFYTADEKMVWGSAMYQGDNYVAFGEEMVVGYKIGPKDLEHSVGDTIVDLCRKNGREKLLVGLDEILKPITAPAAAVDASAAGTSGA